MLDPHQISFSQVTVSKEYDWDVSKYIKKIIVARYDDGHYCSYDNRRLLAAQKVNEPNFRIECDTLEWNVQMNMEREEVEEKTFDYVLTFPMTNIGEANKGVYCLKVTPKTYGTLIAFRCARQGQEMSLDGRQEQPIVASFLNCRKSDYRQKGKRQKMDHVSNDEAYELLQNAISEGKPICVSIQDAGQFFVHPELPNYLNGNVRQFLLIRQAYLYVDQWLRAAADFDDSDEYLDREAAERDVLYHAELDNLMQELETENDGNS